MKKTFLFIAILAIALTSCRKEALVNFNYSTTSEWDYSEDVPYVLLSTYNLSVNADYYKWELTSPLGTYITSEEVSPAFRCYVSGYYELKLTAYTNNGDYKTEAKNIYISVENGGSVDPDDPDDPTVPSRFTITYLRLQDIPMLDGSNASWDTGLFGGGDPDVYFKIYDANENLLYTSAEVTDLAENDLPYTWTGVNQILNYNASQYLIRFYDADGDLDSDDFMAGCILEPSNMTPGSSTYVWYNNDMGVQFTLGTTWSY